MLRQDFTMETSMEGMLKRHALSGIIAAILMIAVGVLLFINPLAVSIGAGILIAIGIGIEGIYILVRYFSSKSRSAWDLVLAIINILFAGWILTLWMGDSKALTVGVILNFLAMIFAIVLLMSGFNKLNFASSLKMAGEYKTGMITFSGWLNIILAFFFIISPFVTTLTFEWMSGIYLIVSGIILLIEAIALMIAKG
ncbi:DUF308 domain-containing protein [Anaerorhabdus furcosa]|uniref:Uncharacterized membrane protein HdeD, DUF308 family n=1 Tax=Anaerorhabdus furcosa TaxID=118967 RepID=A0A1T4K2P3_9FIRM|nr:DUF308 domain-containing protein [Anaerorhabdus furcosa]SJZ36595.1 Uncharacterized membrane protein HdeD, DUF308 family [Anaerorhabdus furcosa]